MIRQLAHLNFLTKNIDTIIDFYVNKLGLKIKFTLDNKAGEPLGYYFECGNSTFIEVFDQIAADKEWGSGLVPLTAGTRYKHFCLEIVGLDEYCAALKSKGVQVTDIITGMDHSRQAWIKDPDGNEIELMEYGPTSLQLTGK